MFLLSHQLPSEWFRSFICIGVEELRFHLGFPHNPLFPATLIEAEISLQNSFLSHSFSFNLLMCILRLTKDLPIGVFLFWERWQLMLRVAISVPFILYGICFIMCVFGRFVIVVCTGGRTVDHCHLPRTLVGSSSESAVITGSVITFFHESLSNLSSFP